MSKFPLGLLSSGVLLSSIFSFSSPAYASFPCDVGKPIKNRNYDYNAGKLLNVLRGWIIRVEDPEKVKGYKTLERLLSTNGLQKLPEATFQSNKYYGEVSNHGVFAFKNSQGSTLSVALNPGLRHPHDIIQCVDYKKNLVIFYNLYRDVIDINSGSRLPAIGIVREVRSLVYEDKYGSF